MIYNYAASTRHFLFRANLLACLSLAKHKSDRAARMQTSRHKNIRRQNAVGYFFVGARSRDERILRADESRPRSSILYDLSPGQDDVCAQKVRSKPCPHPLARSYQNRVEWRRFAPQRLREGRPNRTYVRDRPRDVLVGAKVRRYTRFYSAT